VTIAPLHPGPARFDGGLLEIAPGVHGWLQPNGLLGESNAGLVIGDGASLLVDTPWDHRLTRPMLDAMAPLTADAPIRTVVNSHSDGDRWWGNALVAAETIATDAAAAVMARQSPAEMKRFGALASALTHAGSVPVPYPRPADVATIAAYVGEALAPFAFGEVRLVPPVREMWVPGARVVLAADILFIGVTPIMWAGPVCGAEEVQRLLEYWRWLDQEAAQGLDAGRSVSEIARELAAAKFGGWLAPERALVNVGHRRGTAGPPGPREIVPAFFRMALLAREVG
jgi:hypothetical protein